MLHLKKKLAVGATSIVLALCGAACGNAADDAGSAAASGQTTSTTAAAEATTGAPADAPSGGGPGGGGQSVASVSTEDELVSLIQEAYGEPSLGLHRGHQDVESTLIDVLGISHDEMHVRMDSGQNLAAIADDLGIDRQKLVDALVATRSPAVEALVEAGTITEAEGASYLEELEDAYTFRVTWDGTAATPTAESV